MVYGTGNDDAIMSTVIIIRELGRTIHSTLFLLMYEKRFRHEVIQQNFSIVDFLV